MKTKTSLIIIASILSFFVAVYSYLYFNGEFSKTGDFDDCPDISYSSNCATNY